jgi:hypothetical protein
VVDSLLVMAGLDPAIHAQPARIFRASLDAQIKSGHDGANDRFHGFALLEGPFTRHPNLADSAS